MFGEGQEHDGHLCDTILSKGAREAPLQSVSERLVEAESIESLPVRTTLSNTRERGALRHCAQFVSVGCDMCEEGLGVWL